jgi:YgiT-type zinc finger domain-containing protein
MKGKKDGTAPAVWRKDLASEQGKWEQVAQEVLTGLKDWRAQHPRATFAEIEQALDTRLSRLRTRLLEDVALASAATEGAAAPEGARCPTCGGALVPRGQTTRAVTVRENQTVTLRRGYAVCSACGAGVSPPR